MSSARKPVPGKNPESYSPKDKPVILNVAEEMKNMAVNKYTVKSANGGKFIDGVPRLKWGEWKDCSYGGAVKVILNTIGINASYEQVMGLSGACYRIAMTDNWCPSASMLQVGYNSESNVNKAFGIDVYSIKDVKERDEQVINSINTGVPVLICGQRWEPEWSVVCGYAKIQENIQFFGRTYFDYQSAPENETFTDNGYFYADKYPGEFPQVLLRFYNRACEPIPLKDALKVSLETCIRMFEQQPKNYKHGYDAYEILIAGFEKDDEEYRRDCTNDQYFIGSLMDARHAAHVYLDENTSMLMGDNKKKLKITSELYKNMLDTLLAVVPYEKSSVVFNENASPVWDTTTRRNLAGALREIIEMEKKVRSIISDILNNWK